MDAHIVSIHRVYNKLNLLVNSLNPTTPDDIFTSALITSLPDDWVHVVTTLMQPASVGSRKVMQAIQAESPRRKSLTTFFSSRNPLVAKASSL